MAVLVEGISVVVRRVSIARVYPDSWDSFVAQVPNATLCYDDEIARVGFLSPQEIENYVGMLKRCGLTFLHQGNPVDLAMADQLRGLTTQCDWLEFGRFPCEGGEISACWVLEGPRMGHGTHIQGTSLELSTPDGWKFEGSLSDKFTFVPTEQSLPGRDS